MGTRVLVVDDAKFMRHMIKNLLGDLGYDVVGEACNGEEALQMYGELSPDIVTMDVVMPDVDGLAALRSIREKDDNAKVIMISAIDQREPLMEAMKAGAVDYIVKPFEKERVQEALQRVMAG